MSDGLVLDLSSKNLVTDLLVLDIGYDVCNNDFYDGEFTTDFYGRVVPKHAHGTIRLKEKSASPTEIRESFVKLLDSIINKSLYTRRITLVAGEVQTKKEYEESGKVRQLDLFTNIEEEEQEKEKNLKEDNLQKTLLSIKYKYGKNSILKGMNLEEGGTAIERNGQVGGHKG